MRSNLTQLGTVEFPRWTGVQVYMLPFTKKDGLPHDLRVYQQTVDAMLTNIHTDETMFLMIDEKFVKKGEYHRRPGVHVDGFWNPAMYTHGGGHGSTPKRGGHHGGRHTGIGKSEGLLLASNTGDAQAYLGEFNRDLVSDWRGGDCAEVDVSQLMPVYLERNIVHAADVFTLHESLPVKEDCFRSLVRINVPNWSIQ